MRCTHRAGNQACARRCSDKSGGGVWLEKKYTKKGKSKLRVVRRRPGALRTTALTSIFLIVSCFVDSVCCKYGFRPDTCSDFGSLTTLRGARIGSSSFLLVSSSSSRSETSESCSSSGSSMSDRDMKVEDMIASTIVQSDQPARAHARS